MADPRPPDEPTHPLPLADLTGAALAGGQASRFGADKALARVGGRTLLGRVLDSFDGMAARLVVGRSAPLEGARAVPDRLAGRGPLAGLHAALEEARTPWVALAACDLPCLTPAYWRRLAAHAPGREAVVAVDEAGRFEPLAALYRTDLAPRVAARLEHGALRLSALLASVDVARVPLAALRAELGEAVLLNVNRREELRPDPCGDGGAVLASPGAPPPREGPTS